MQQLRALKFPVLTVTNDQQLSPWKHAAIVSLRVHYRLQNTPKWLTEESSSMMTSTLLIALVLVSLRKLRTSASIRLSGNDASNLEVMCHSWPNAECFLLVVMSTAMLINWNNTVGLPVSMCSPSGSAWNEFGEVFSAPWPHLHSCWHVLWVLISSNTALSCFITSGGVIVRLHKGWVANGALQGVPWIN